MSRYPTSGRTAAPAAKTTGSTASSPARRRAVPCSRTRSAPAPWSCWKSSIFATSIPFSRTKPTRSKRCRPAWRRCAMPERWRHPLRGCGSMTQPPRRMPRRGKPTTPACATGSHAATIASLQLRPSTNRPRSARRARGTAITSLRAGLASRRRHYLSGTRPLGHVLRNSSQGNPSMTRQVLLAAVAALAFAVPGVVRADDQPIETAIVDAMNKAFGVHPGFRANHAKGLVTEGSFTAAPEAAALSKAVLFDGRKIPVTVRFSDATGIPDLPDGAEPANPHGMAIKYHLPDGSDTDMVINSLKFFPVSSGDDFRDLLLAVAASPPDAPKPTKLDEFVAAHPTVPAALATAATPDSFADEEYYGINAFVFIDKAGNRQAVRYQMVPERVVHLSAADAAKMPPNFLMDELPQRLKQGPVTFHLKA